MDLREYLFRERMEVKDFADKIGYARSYLSLIKNKKVMPSKRLKKAIEEATGGQVKDEDYQ